MSEKMRHDKESCSARRSGRVGLERLQGMWGWPVSLRLWSISSGGPTRPPFLVGVTVAALLIFSACTSADSDDSTSTSSIPPTTSTTSHSSSTSTDAPAPSTSTSTSIAPTTTVPPPEEVVDAWNAYWAAWAEVRVSESLDPAPLEAVASSDVVAGALALFERERSSGVGPVQTEVVLHAAVTDQDSDRASVEDCVLLSPSFTETVGVWYEADLTRTGEGWIVDTIRIPSGGGCVPHEMADAAIDGYEAYYDAEADFWDPPNPDSRLLDNVLVEPQRSFIVELLELHRTRGVALRGQPATHPEVIEVRSPTELVILSCSEPDPDYGLYDLDSGKRLSDEPPIRAGQRDLQSAVMVLDGGTWKVSDFQGQVDFACEFAPTDRGLPSI